MPNYLIFQKTKPSEPFDPLGIKTKNPNGSSPLGWFRDG
jgi:hypothetical protein